MPRNMNDIMSHNLETCLELQFELGSTLKLENSDSKLTQCYFSPYQPKKHYGIVQNHLEQSIKS